MRKLTQLERRVLAYPGQPAHAVAVAERITIAEVLEIRERLRGRGIDHSPHTTDVQQPQLDDVGQLMRDNRAPKRPQT